MRTLMRGALRRCLLLGLFAAAAAAGHAQPLSERQLIELAGQGRYEELANRLAPTLDKLSTGELHALCYSYSKLKRYRQLFACLDRLESAVRGRDQATLLFGLDDATPTVYLMRAEANIDIGQTQEATAQAQRAADWFKKEGGAGELDIRIDTLAALGLAAAHAGDKTKAAEYAQQLDAIKISWDTAANVATVRSFALARVHLALAQYERACAALEADRKFDFRKSIEELLHFAPPNWVWQQLPRNYMLAKCRLGMGRTAEAKAGYDELLKIPSIRQNTGLYWLILFDRGRIAEDEGDLDGAIRFYREAIEIIELLRSSINTEAAKIGFVGDKQALYGALITLLLRRERAAEALEYVERAKSRALVDLLADRFVAVPWQNLDRGDQRLAGLLEQHRRAEEALLTQSPGKTDAVLVQQRNALVAATANVRKASPEVASLIAVSPTSAAELAKLLDADEVGVQYFLFGERLYALTFGAQGSRGFDLSGVNLNADIRQFRNELAQRSPRSLQLARALYTRLIAPLEPALRGKPLLIVPHSGLHYLPFAALHDGKQYLIDKHAVRIMTSATALQFLRRPGPNTLPTALVLGNPTLDLPSAEDEARRLGRLLKGSRVLLGRDATRAAFLENGPRYRTLHIAAHGIYEPRQPLESKLLLAKGTAPSGELKAGELYALTLNADLVTLSACETGLGRITDGDDVIGMTRGFMYAGATSIVASLWEVADEATLELMERFYANLGKMNKRDALRAAQIATAKKIPEPYFWAAFYLTGAAK